MSWDVLVFQAPHQVAAVDELPGDFDPPPLGTLADISERLRASLPGLDLTEADWGRLAGPTWTIELGLGSEDPVATIMLYVRGTGDDVLDTIATITGAVGGRALDVSTGQFLTGDPTETAGWHGFQRHRDQIFDQT